MPTVLNKTMIRLKSLDCKIKNLFFSIIALFKRSLEKNPVYEQMCPFCGATGQCRMHGSYTRNLLHFSDGHTQTFRLKVPRVLCSCGHSHALLPDFIVPYLSYSLPMTLMVLADYFSGRMTISKICDKYDITVPVIYRLKKLFLIHKKEWLGVLGDMETVASDFLSGLLDSQNYSADALSFLRKTTYSFLQSHKNPANCARPYFPENKMRAPVHNL